MARGQARYWPDGQVNAVYPNGDGARDLRDLHGALPRVAVALLRLDGRPRHGAARCTRRCLAVADWLWSTRQAGTGLLYGLGDTSNGDPVYGYDLTVAADTASNVLAVNALRRVAQLAAVAGDAAGGATWPGPGRPAGRRRSTPCCAGPTASTSTVSMPTARQSSHASQEANALALAYGVVPAPTVAAVGAYVASLGIASGPTTVSSSCAGWPPPACPRPWCAR